MNEKSVRQFWDEQADAFQESDLATAPDRYYREMEIVRILSHLSNGGTILDVGCGNGYSTLHFAKALPSSKVVGIDYSEPMIRHARAALAKSNMESRVEFFVGNVLSLAINPAINKEKFDTILSERCLINLQNWEEQRTALLQMKQLLKPGGRIILTENTQEGLAKLNELRVQLELSPIAVRWHNSYIPQKNLEKFLSEHFAIDAIENIGNLYYIISRVVYAKLAALEGKEPEYLHPINKIASQLPSLPEYQYSPNFIYVLRLSKNA
jgi:ubiquinone/menaquinone biosynthesis C-methylase UbiE